MNWPQNSQRIDCNSLFLPFLRILCVLCGYFCFSEVANSAPQEVLPLDGKSFAGELASIADDGNVTFQLPQGAEDGATSVRLLNRGELVRWGHPVAARPQTIVVLADGGLLVTAADWSGGAAVRLSDDAVTVLSDTFEEVRFPRDSVRGVVFAQRQHPNERIELVARVREDDADNGRVAEDSVLLTNGDRHVGRLTEIAGGLLALAMQSGTAQFPLSRVEAVRLGGRQPPAAGHEQDVAVGLRDGSVLNARAARGNKSELVLELADGVQLSGGSVEDVVTLQSLNGPVVYLSDLEPAAYRHVPYLDLTWDYEPDRNVLGGPLVVGGERYLKGIGMHSAARLTYRLNGEYRRFDAAVAVDDAAEGRGSVTFGVYLLRDGEWREAFDSGVVRGGDAPRPVSVDVTGAEGLTLTVDYADRGDEMDRADWLDARLIKE